MTHHFFLVQEQKKEKEKSRQRVEAWQRVETLARAHPDIERLSHMLGEQCNIMDSGSSSNNSSSNSSTCGAADTTQIRASVASNVPATASLTSSAPGGTAGKTPPLDSYF